MLGLRADPYRGEVGDERLLLGHSVEPGNPSLGSWQAAARADLVEVRTVRLREPQYDFDVGIFGVVFLVKVLRLAVLDVRRSTRKLPLVTSTEVADPVIVLDGTPHQGITAQLAARPLLCHGVVGAVALENGGFQLLAERRGSCHAILRSRWDWSYSASSSVLGANSSSGRRPRELTPWS